MSGEMVREEAGKVSPSMLLILLFAVALNGLIWLVIWWLGGHYSFL